MSGGGGIRSPDKSTTREGSGIPQLAGRYPAGAKDLPGKAGAHQLGNKSETGDEEKMSKSTEPALGRNFVINKKPGTTPTTTNNDAPSWIKNSKSGTSTTKPSSLATIDGSISPSSPKVNNVSSVAGKFGKKSDTDAAETFNMGTKFGGGAKQIGGAKNLKSLDSVMASENKTTTSQNALPGRGQPKIGKTGNDTGCKPVGKGTENNVAVKMPEESQESSEAGGPLSGGKTKGLAGFWSNQNDEVKVVKKKRFIADDSIAVEGGATPETRGVLESTPQRLEGVVRAEDPGEWSKPIELEPGKARNIASTFQQRGSAASISPAKKSPIRLTSEDSEESSESKIKVKDISEKLIRQKSADIKRERIRSDNDLTESGEIQPKVKVKDISEKLIRQKSQPTVPNREKIRNDGDNSNESMDNQPKVKVKDISERLVRQTSQPVTSQRQRERIERASLGGRSEDLVDVIVLAENEPEQVSSDVVRSEIQAKDEPVFEAGRTMNLLKHWMTTEVEYNAPKTSTSRLERGSKPQWIAEIEEAKGIKVENMDFNEEEYSEDEPQESQENLTNVSERESLKEDQNDSRKLQKDTQGDATQQQLQSQQQHLLKKLPEHTEEQQILQNQQNLPRPLQDHQHLDQSSQLHDSHHLWGVTSDSKGRQVGIVEPTPRKASIDEADFNQVAAICKSNSEQPTQTQVDHSLSLPTHNRTESENLDEFSLAAETPFPSELVQDSDKIFQSIVPNTTANNLELSTNTDNKELVIEENNGDQSHKMEDQIKDLLVDLNKITDWHSSKDSNKNVSAGQDAMVADLIGLDFTSICPNTESPQLENSSSSSLEMAGLASKDLIPAQSIHISDDCGSVVLTPTSSNDIDSTVPRQHLSIPIVRFDPSLNEEDGQLNPARGARPISVYVDAPSDLEDDVIMSSDSILGDDNQIKHSLTSDAACPDNLMTFDDDLTSSNAERVTNSNAHRPVSQFEDALDRQLENLEQVRGTSKNIGQTGEKYNTKEVEPGIRQTNTHPETQGKGQATKKSEIRSEVSSGPGNQKMEGKDKKAGKSDDKAGCVVM